MASPNLSDIDLRLLRVFQGVVRHSGFSAAQDDLGLTQATISNHMTQLEERLGMRLCERGRGGFYLTDYGKLIYEATLNLFRSIENFHGIVGSIRGELLGELHFGTVDAMYTNDELDLPRILKTFSDIAPRVVVHIDMASPQRLLQGLLEERYHVILVPADKMPTSVRSWSLLDEEQSLFCGAKHSLFPMADEDITVGTLSKAPFAGRSYTRDEDTESGIKFEWRAIASHMESRALLILSGGYIGYLPTHYAEQFVHLGKMRRLLPAETTYTDRMYLAHRQQERNNVAHRFVECFLKQKVQIVT